MSTSNHTDAPDATLTTEQFIQRAKELRREADDAEERFLAFLYEGESMRQIWADGTGCATYPEFLERNNICKAIRYMRYKRVCDGAGPDAVQGVGVEAVMAAGAFTAPEPQREVLAQARTWEKTNGTAISQQSANRIAHDVKVRSAAQSPRAKGWAELVVENEQLHAEVEQLKSENASLRAELKKAKTSAKKPIRKAARAEYRPS